MATDTYHFPARAPGLKRIEGSEEPGPAPATTPGAFVQVRGKSS